MTQVITAIIPRCREMLLKNLIFSKAISRMRLLGKVLKPSAITATQFIIFAVLYNLYWLTADYRGHLGDLR